LIRIGHLHVLGVWDWVTIPDLRNFFVDSGCTGTLSFLTVRCSPSSRIIEYSSPYDPSPIKVLEPKLFIILISSNGNLAPKPFPERHMLIKYAYKHSGMIK
jgi:hypothetical protein